MPANKRRYYAKINWKELDWASNGLIGVGAHEAKEKYCEELGSFIRTGGEIDFVKMDRDEIRTRVIDRNRRKLEKLAKNVEVEGLVSRLLGSITALKSPEEPKHPNG